jgi:hypothetical protein
MFLAATLLRMPQLRQLDGLLLRELYEAAGFFQIATRLTVISSSSLY